MSVSAIESQIQFNSELNENDSSWLVVFGRPGGIIDLRAASQSADRIHRQCSCNPAGYTLELIYSPGSKHLSVFENSASFTIFYGQLFSLPKLSKELATEGQILQPAEIVSLSYQKWGERFLEHIQGSFNIIHWDLEKNKFYSVRDRLGRQPLFYACVGLSLAFSPSINELINRLNLSRAPNRAAIILTLSDLSAAAHETYFESVFRLRPGHVLCIDRDFEQTYRYWEPAPPDTPDENMQEADLDEFDSLFEQAVYRYTSLGKTGIFLSGGLDSVSIAAVAKDLADREKKRDPLALSIAFPDPLSNEEQRQRNVAQQLGLQQVILPFDEAAGEKGLIWSALEISACLDTPLQNPWLPVYLRLAQEGQQQHCEVILTGAGGDEWMAVNTAYMSDLIRRVKISEAANFMRSLLKSYNLPRPAMFWFALWSSGLRPVLGYSGRRLLSRVAPQNINQFRQLRRTSSLSSAIPSWISAEPTLRSNINDRINQIVDLELQKPEISGAYGFYNATSVSANFDRAIISMEQEEEHQIGRWLGILYGHPFWDAELVQFLCRIPPRLLIVDGREKSIVRQSIAKRFPELGFEKQKKVMASQFYFSNLIKGGRSAWEKIGGLQKLENLDIILPSKSNQIFLDLISSPNYRKAFLAWELLNFEVWLRSHV